MAVVNIADEAIKVLHPAWDAALVVADENSLKKFLVSSQVLRIASTYFNTLFTSNFEEGTKTQEGLKPEIHLHDDSPDAVEVILSILHYQYKSEWNTMSPESFAVIATHCDKYCCTASLRPWVDKWIANSSRIIERRDIGCLLLATSAFGEALPFQKISRLAVLQLPLDYDFNSWSKDETLASLPGEITTNQSDIGRMHSSRCNKCLRVYEKSRSSGCPDCPLGKGEQPGAGDYQVFCCSETRVAECTLILTKHQLYPNERVWRKGPIAEIARRFNMVRETRTHKCNFDQHCPLRKRLGELDEAVLEVIEGIQGQKLGPLVANEPVKSGDEGEGEANYGGITCSQCCT
ncbi:btb poz-like protein [Colletotrichum incanum]|uniref:Btb poz-like protein n=1 Tax=Colletotrichum incanum TaxID=1573173 RepID=A0A167E527_COLIC|nr:btb poz-like protein [Colletotrichum incanum]